MSDDQPVRTRPLPAVRIEVSGNDPHIVAVIVQRIEKELRSPERQNHHMPHGHMQIELALNQDVHEVLEEIGGLGGITPDMLDLRIYDVQLVGLLKY